MCLWTSGGMLEQISLVQGVQQDKWRAEGRLNGTGEQNGEEIR